MFTNISYFHLLEVVGRGSETQLQVGQWDSGGTWTGTEGVSPLSLLTSDAYVCVFWDVNWDVLLFLNTHRGLMVVSNIRSDMRCADPAGIIDVNSTLIQSPRYSPPPVWISPVMLDLIAASARRLSLSPGGVVRPRDLTDQWRPRKHPKWPCHCLHGFTPGNMRRGYNAGPASKNKVQYWPSIGFMSPVFWDGQIFCVLLTDWLKNWQFYSFPFWIDSSRRLLALRQKPSLSSWKFIKIQTERLL